MIRALAKEQIDAADLATVAQVQRVFPFRLCVTRRR